MNEKSIPPCSPESEALVLSCLLCDTTETARILSEVERNDFYSPKNVKIFDLAKKVFDSGEAVDLNAIRILDPELSEYAIEIASDFTSSHAVESAIQTLKDKRSCRALVESSYWIQATASNGIVDYQEFFSAAKARIDNSITLKKNIFGRQLMDGIDSSWINREVSDFDFRTGFYDLDNVTQGLRKKELIILGARSQAGKTGLAISMLCRLARQGHSVLFFSQEMDFKSIQLRALSQISGVPFSNVAMNRTTPEQRELIEAARIQALNWRFTVDEAKHPYDRIRSLSILHKSRGNADIIFLDHLHQNIGGKPENVRHEITKAVQSFKQIAKDVDVPFIALAQLNRKAIENRPTLEHLKESGGIEENADIVILLHRDDAAQKDESLHDHMANLFVAKNRNGACKEITLRFDGPTMRFDNLVQ